MHARLPSIPPEENDLGFQEWRDWNPGELRAGSGESLPPFAYEEVLNRYFGIRRIYRVTTCRPGNRPKPGGP